jgi:hypothetical protein
MADDIRPDTRSAAYNLMAPRWEMLRTIMSGTPAMREAGKTYLPQFAAESDDDYDARLQKTVLTNYLEDAVRNAASLPFKKPISISESTPEPIKLILEDVDLQGRDITRFATEVMHDGVTAGYTFILVDFPRVADKVQNLGQEKAMKARPYWVHLKADDVVAVYSTRINGVETITHLRFLEETVERVEFKEVTVRRVRVYEPGLYSVYREDPETKKWVLDESGPMSIPIVPIVPIMCGRSEGSPFVVKPLFMDLAFKQIEHWQSASDQRNILSFARFPLLAVAGIGTDSTDTHAIGPGKLLATSDPQGKWYYVEPSGNAIEAGRKDLETLKEEMRILGLQPQIGETGSVTATARALDETRVHSAVQVLALNLEDALNQAIDLTCLWLNIQTEEATVQVNRDFGISLRDARELEALIRTRVAGELSRETFWSELKRRNVLSADFNSALEIELLEQEAVMGVLPGNFGMPGTNQSDPAQEDQPREEPDPAVGN